jgi:para-nitrobenzyl esterase
MIRIALAAGVALGLMSAAPASAALNGPVRIDSGLLSGAVSSDGAVTAFKGVPYAAPPVGDLRWRPPQPAAPWQGVRAADQYGPICPQAPPQGLRDRPMSEDCLHLDVWTAAKAAREGRPVMVWFHGGGPFGADSEPNFDGEALARKGVVVVTVNYRLGVLGNLATPELSRESGHGASGDYGLMDDVAALKWVQRNIAAFGGDPKNVTLFGQSFGAGTQHMLSLSPLAKGLYQRMIVESHARYPRDPTIFEVATAYRTLDEAEANGRKFAEALGAKTLKEMREAPLPKVMEAARTATGAGHVVDGYVVPHGYSETYALGAQNDVFVIAGFTRDETGALPDTAFDRAHERAIAAATNPPPRTNNVPQPIATLDGYRSYAQRRFGPMADEFMKLYPATSDREAFLASNAAVRDNGRVSLWMWAGAWRKAGTKPVYLYFWDHAPPGKNHDFTGAYHESEIAYVFNHESKLDEPWTADDRRIADAMSSYWVNYARTGDPNGPGLAKWAAFDGKTEQVMEVGDRFGPLPPADKAKVDFWKRFYETQPSR